nr:hypothetical protein [Acidiferrobacter sp. SPIII_3]
MRKSASSDMRSITPWAWERAVPPQKMMWAPIWLPARRHDDAEVGILGHALDHTVGLGEGRTSAKDDVGAYLASSATDDLYGIADQEVFLEHCAA